MLRRKFLTAFLAAVATGVAFAPAFSLADHQGNGRGRGRGRRRRNQFEPKSFYREGPSGPSGPSGRSSGPDRARRALREGSVLPLGDIMGIVSRRFPGKVLDADLVREDRRFVYYLKVLDRRGRVTEVAVDGRSGRILGVRGRGR